MVQPVDIHWQPGAHPAHSLPPPSSQVPTTIIPTISNTTMVVCEISAFLRILPFLEVETKQNLSARSIKTKYALEIILATKQAVN